MYCYRDRCNDCITNLYEKKKGEEIFLKFFESLVFYFTCYIFFGRGGQKGCLADLDCLTAHWHWEVTG